MAQSTKHVQHVQVTPGTRMSLDHTDAPSRPKRVKRHRSVVDKASSEFRINSYVCILKQMLNGFM